MTAQQRGENNAHKLRGAVLDDLGLDDKMPQKGLVASPLTGSRA